MKKFAKVLMIILLIACVDITFVACGKDKSDGNKQVPLYTGMSVDTGNSHLANAPYIMPTIAAR